MVEGDQELWGRPADERGSAVNRGSVKRWGKSQTPSVCEGSAARHRSLELRIPPPRSGGDRRLPGLRDVIQAMFSGTKNGGTGAWTRPRTSVVFLVCFANGRSRRKIASEVSRRGSYAISPKLSRPPLHGQILRTPALIFTPRWIKPKGRPDREHGEPTEKGSPCF